MDYLLSVSSIASNLATVFCAWIAFQMYKVEKSQQSENPSFDKDSSGSTSTPAVNFSTGNTATGAANTTAPASMNRRPAAVVERIVEWIVCPRTWYVLIFMAATSYVGFLYSVFYRDRTSILLTWFGSVAGTFNATAFYGLMRSKAISHSLRHLGDKMSKNLEATQTLAESIGEQAAKIEEQNKRKKKAKPE